MAPVEKSFLAKYWVYMAIPIVLLISEYALYRGPVTSDAKTKIANETFDLEAD